MKALGIKEQPAEFPYLSRPWDISLMSAACLWRLGQRTNLLPPPRGSTCHRYFVIFIKLNWEYTNFFSLCFQPKLLSLHMWCLFNKINEKENSYISYLQNNIPINIFMFNFSYLVFLTIWWTCDKGSICSQWLIQKGHSPLGHCFFLPLQFTFRKSHFLKDARI